ncbi:MAG TPA: apolipoprotein N-acyltransferase [Thermodesulfobacteriota bacterium]
MTSRLRAVPPGAVASGLLLTAALPDWNLWPLAFVALVPLLTALEGRGPAEAARVGLVAGLVHAATTVYWVTYTLRVYGDLPWVVAAAVMLLLASYLAAYPAVWAAGLAYAGRGKAPLPVAALALAVPLWVGLEWLRSWLLTGFPWMLLGYSQYRQLALIQVADLGGVYVVSALLVAANVALYGLARARAQGAWRRPAALAAGAALALGASLAYGAARLAALESAGPQAARTVEVGIVQGNVPQDRKWDPAFQAETVETYRSLTVDVAGRGARLVVWPETAVPAFFQRDPRIRPAVLDTARRAGVDLVFGAPSAEMRPPRTPEGEPRVVLFNSAYVVGAEGRVKGRYDKQHLVPFGEYVPLSGLLFFVNKLAQGIGDFEAGRGMPPIEAAGARLGILICYEAIFPDLARRMVADGAQVLVNITNDAWFGRTAAPEQHLAQAVFRAVELKRPLVRAANTGISAIVAPSGRIDAVLGLFTRGALTGSIAVPQPDAGASTLYTRTGDRFAQLCTLAAGVALFLTARRRRGERPSPAPGEARR